MGKRLEGLQRIVTLRMEERGYTGVNLRTLHLRERVRHIYEAALRRNT